MSTSDRYFDALYQSSADPWGFRERWYERRKREPVMLGILIPAHNEEALLSTCLDSATRAMHHPGLKGEKVAVALVLDRCTDRSAEIAQRYDVHCLHADEGNVGGARAIGARYLMNTGARWLASTDADSRVSDDWLVMQLSLQADMVCGTVRVEDWEAMPEPMTISSTWL